ncbi:MAG: GumC family protein [Chthoniobacteraceae bacterium]
MNQSDSNEKSVPKVESGRSRLAIHIKWPRYKRILWTHWWVLVLTIGLAMAFAGWRNISAVPEFESRGIMMVSGQISLPGSAVYNEDVGNFFGTQVSLMESQMIRSQAEATLQAKRPDLTPCSVKITASQKPRSSLFILQALGSEPNYVRALLDTVMQEYINAKKDMQSQKSETTISAISEQLDTLEKKIKAGEDELISFQKVNNITFIQTENSSTGAYLNRIDQKLAAFNTEYQLLNLLSADAYMNRQRNDPPEQGTVTPDSDAALLSSSSSAQADYLKAKQQIKLLKASLEDFSHYLRPKHPIVIQLSNQITLQEILIKICQEESKSQLSNQRESIRLQIENLKSERNVWNSKALDLSGRTAQYDSIKAKLDRLKSLYEHLLLSMQAVDVNKDINQGSVAILEKASIADPVNSAVRKTIFTALAAGLIVGIGILLIIEKLDDRIVSSNEFHALFPGSILGYIPKVENKENKGLLLNDLPILKAFQGVRSSLLFSSGKSTTPRIILVTSAVPGEGKTTIAAHLAASLASDGAKTLLVDTDVYRGIQHTIFGLKNEVGFSDIISGDVHWQDAALACNVDNLSVIPSGQFSAEAGKHILGEITDEFLEEASRMYKWIILDGAPLLAIDDTAVLASKVDSIIKVVRLGFSRARGLETANDLLEKRKINVVGVVLNAVDATFEGYSDYYYRCASYYADAVKS